VLSPRFEGAPSSDRVVTFWDLIQAVAVRSLRFDPKAKKISLGHIRSVVAECEKRGIRYPLAADHTLYVFGSRLVLKTSEGVYIGADGVDRDQMYAGQIVEPFLREISFDGERMAESWKPLESSRYQVLLDPMMRFGLPRVSPGNILVESLTQAVASEGGISEAARAFETLEEAVLLALKYQELLSSAA